MCRSFVSFRINCVLTLIVVALINWCSSQSLQAQTYQLQQRHQTTYRLTQQNGKDSSGQSSSQTQPSNDSHVSRHEAESAEELSRHFEVHEIVSKQGVPGLAGAVSVSKDPVSEYVGGVRRINKPTKVKSGDLWHIGSCTKPMTATVIALMINDGLLTKDTTVWELVYESGMFPELLSGHIPNPFFRDVTIEHLLCHRSGIKLPGHINDDTRGFKNCFPNPTKLRWQTMRRLLATPQNGTPGEYKYDNTNYLILGVIIERIMGRSFEQVMQQKLFEPLGMTTARFGMPSDMDLPANFSVHQDAWQFGFDGTSTNPWVMNPYAAFDNPSVEQPIGHWVVGGEIVVDNYALEPAWNPAGGAYMSLEDMLKFARLHLNGSEGSLSLPADLLDEMQTPYNRADRASMTDQNYGWGWSIGWDGSWFLDHNGSYFRFYTNLRIYLDDDIAIATSSNVDGWEPVMGVDSVPGDNAVVELRDLLENWYR